MNDTEREIKRKIRKYLSTIPCSKFFPYNPFYGEAGIPDIIGLIQGKFVAFEVKREGGKLTALQKQKIKEIHEAGGLAEVVHSKKEVEEYLNSICVESKIMKYFRNKKF